jgi:poly(3-hydroxybutyrate) depolymerase
MATALLAVKPRRFAAGAIMAGLPFGAASSVGEAMHAMFHARRRDGADWAARARQASGHDGPWPRISIWQGDDDETVVPANALELEKQWTTLHGLDHLPPTMGSADGHPHRSWVDAEGRIAVESHRIAGLAHGTPIAPAHDGPGGRRISRMGVASDFVLDIGISSTWRIAQSWGLAPQREDAPLVAAKPRAAPRPKVAVAPKAAVPAKRKAARKPRRVAGFGFDPGFGLRLAMAPMASLRRMLGGRKR